MRLSFHRRLAVAAVVVIGNVAGSPVATATDTAIKCNNFIRSGSDLAELLKTLSPRPQCWRSDASEGVYSETLNVFGVARSGTSPVHVELSLFRSNARNWLRALSTGENQRVLSESLALRLGDFAARGEVTRFERPDLGNVTFACVSAAAPKADKFMFDANMCHSVKIAASDDEVMAVARDLAEKYLPDIKP